MYGDIEVYGSFCFDDSMHMTIKAKAVVALKHRACPLPSLTDTSPPNRPLLLQQYELSGAQRGVGSTVPAALGSLDTATLAAA